MLRAANRLLGSRPWAPPCVSSFSTESDYVQVLNTATQVAPQENVPANEIGLCAGVPLETFKRKARIFSPSRTASQQGQARTTFNTNAPSWKIAFSTTSKWENPLMGWTSTADPLENVARSMLLFYTPEEAAAFCEKHGWEYTIERPNQRRTTRQKRYLGYGDNFSIKRKGVPDLTTLRGNTTGTATPSA